MKHRLFAATCLSLAAFGLGLAMGLPMTHAEGITKGIAPSVPVEAGTFDMVVDPQEMAEVEQISARIDEHLSLLSLIHI